MTKLNLKHKKGFTIIEVVLVLAIAGLIFMMVFAALPALQRSQKDTQRSQDIARMLDQVVNYESNNRGKIPSTGTAIQGADTSVDLKVDDQPYNRQSMGTTSWGYFYASYLLVESGGTTDVFADPNGDPYGIVVSECGTNLSAGDSCTNGQRSDMSWDEQSEGVEAGGFQKVPFAISVVYHATCDGENAVYTSGSRRIAILYKKEGGGAICVNN